MGTDGPLMIKGRVRIGTPQGDVVRETDRVALCRCGGTGNQPFCDGSHVRVGFKSTR
jgi:CDGSH-type Zn-finger protein